MIRIGLETDIIFNNFTIFLEKVEKAVEKKFRKVMKIAAATTIATTAYAAVNPAQSEAASTAENLVKKRNPTKFR